ncbi:Cobalamin synthase [Acidisarcina polymorpha]|uniref:Adenosylcobinamide-GDP ribazoletransferase n=1 Tax=Acidisarcina polymorpha TaxID=2211140 RepID=A0A2Z5G6W7_9BACT|nr:adenosylcobinamide-GDP ribazoletransferase [Acidisarcina polymorpha]AXC14405.1 Cobalamin synthase [Acidisarcina polymorpha]
MSGATYLKRSGLDFFVAVQFLTRIPVPKLAYDPGSLSRAVKFFPVVGLLIGGAAAVAHLLLAPHLPRLIVALLVISLLVLLTGCLHEDGLADSADAFGGGWKREQVLAILKDSRIGSYGAAALILSILARVLLLAALPLNQIAQYLIAAHVLCRWTTLPLSYYLAPARHPVEEPAASQGARIARLTTRGTLIAASILSFGIVLIALKRSSVAAIAATLLIALLSASYYKRRIGGVTGDCFGATNQLTEIAVYLTGVWVA